jgi:hypothetical protein
MVYKVLVPHKYYLNYEKKTGIIRSISNEKSLHGDASFEVSFDEYKAFSLGQRRAQDHMIGYAKDPITGKTKKSIIQVTDQLYGFRNNTFEWINESPKKNTELIVEWNSKRQSWIFSLSENGKLRLQDEPFGKTIFFVMLKNDFDFLIRSIILEVSVLINEENIAIPFTSNIEQQIEKISISSQVYFQNYGLIINDQD